MKSEVTRDLVYDFNNMFSLKTELLLRDVVIQYLDYFFPNAANNPSALIDNKIEQAMDLVKSHLMYTMREEVEVLKERISELLERINKLEMENNFLKANASPEVLNALNARFVKNPLNNTSSVVTAPTN